MKQVLRLILKILLFPLQILSHLGGVGSKAHMDSNNQMELLAKHKSEDMKRKTSSHNASPKGYRD